MNAIEIVGLTAAAIFISGPITATIRAIIDGHFELSGPFTQVDVVKAMALAAKEGWLHRFLVALDIFCNVTFLRGQQDETISTHSYRASLEGKLWGKLMTGWLNLFQANHGAKAASGDLQRAQVRVATLLKILGGSVT